MVLQSSISSTTVGNPPCHRCGAPSGGYYIDNLPSCRWCLSQLRYGQAYYNFIPNPSPLPYLIMDNIEPYLTLKVKYCIEGLIPLGYIENHKSNWIDLRVAEDTSLKEGEFKLISLGVAIELPIGYEAIIAPRSSTFKKWGILEANSIGIIDESYCGDNDIWCFAAYATRKATLAQNDRICQFRIIKHQPSLVFEKVESLNNKDRAGFGSTGHR